ncbi:methyltransferase [Leptolyngbya sp. AN03gr2]|uniref:methyltransferase n=1 Tax=unclassified Leptolyngbya TaxID=2650499 RepID=UPI003D31FDEC
MITAKPTSSPNQGIPPQVMMLQMANAYRTSQAIHVAAKLGIADHLISGPQNIQVLAEATQTEPRSLYRLLRALASMGIFAETETGEFELTPRAETLITSAPNSLRDYAIVIGEDWHWQMWDDVLYSVKTGLPAFDHQHQMPFEEYYQNNPAIAAQFDRSMVSLLDNVDSSVFAGYDFSLFNTVVEVGIPGNYGKLMAQLLQVNPHQSGIIVDAESGLNACKTYLKQQGVIDRCQFISGDAFQPMPKGDVYILKNLIHDLNDDRAQEVLKQCCTAMNHDATVLLVEMLVPPSNEPALSKIVDMEALIMSTGGYERTEAQYQVLLASVGLTVSHVIPTRSPFSIIEAVRT